MPRSGPDADPTDIFPFVFGQPPVDDRAALEMLSWFVFGAGLNWRVMKAKWPAFLRAFKNFEPKAVARFGERDIDRLLADAEIIRNGKKITSTIENAREMIAIAKEHGSIAAWLRSYRSDTPTLIGEVKRRFHHIGDTTSRMFLAAADVIDYPTWEPTTRQKRGAMR
jgi:3-methyladenine DNA glycosylase Tag